SSLRGPISRRRRWRRDVSSPERRGGGEGSPDRGPGAVLARSRAPVRGNPARRARTVPGPGPDPAPTHGARTAVGGQPGRRRDAGLPLLVLPLATPVRVAGVKATSSATSGIGGSAGSWLGLLVAFDLVVLAAGTLVYGYLLED